MAKSAPPPGSAASNAKTFFSFVLGIALGFALVVPVLPTTASSLAAGSPQGVGRVIMVGVLALAVLVGGVALVFQVYLLVER